MSRKNGATLSTEDPTHTVTASDVQSSLPAGAVASALARQMSLPSDVPWALRDDATSAFLEDGVAIGDQIDTDARLTVTPKTHLG